MSIIDYFRPVDTMSAEEVRTFLQGKDPGEYNLVDVRQPMEYVQRPSSGSALDPSGGAAGTGWRTRSFQTYYYVLSIRGPQPCSCVYAERSRF